MSFIFIALVYTICQRVASNTDKQPWDYLRILVTAFLGKSGLKQVVFIIPLKIKGGYIKKKNANMHIWYFTGVHNADTLDNFMLIVAKFVQIAVYL